MAWVQWTLVAHGGALAAQPDLTVRLSALARVLDERARGLNSLLALKGKLDMLEAQMQLRKGAGRGSRRRGGHYAEDVSEEEEEEDPVYVEGEEHVVDVEMGDGSDRGGARWRKGRPPKDESGDDDDGFVVTNGIDDEEDEDDDETSDDGSEDESEEDEGAESQDDEEPDHDDVDESAGDEDESEEEAARPSKVQKVGSGAFKKR